jgi:hypothetical protein
MNINQFAEWQQHLTEAIKKASEIRSEHMSNTDMSQLIIHNRMTNLMEVCTAQLNFLREQGNGDHLNVTKADLHRIEIQWYRDHADRVEEKMFEEIRIGHLWSALSVELERRGIAWGTGRYDGVWMFNTYDEANVVFDSIVAGNGEFEELRHMFNLRVATHRD